MADTTMRVADDAVFDRVIVSPSVGLIESQGQRRIVAIVDELEDILHAVPERMRETRDLAKASRRRRDPPHVPWRRRGLPA